MTFSKRNIFSLFFILSLVHSYQHSTIKESNGLGSKCKAPLTPNTDPNTMWIQNIKHDGMAAFNSNPFNYTVYRNVKDYGAKGDGVTDDTKAINAAISSGNRCGEGCDSSTITPALVFFPQGTYLLSAPIIQYYMTQLVGDALNPPTIIASPSFAGIAVIDADPYTSGGNNWYTNQNNFYRQVRNFVIDVTQLASTATCIHWQVAQATSLTNIIFRMSTEPGNNHQGLYMEDGSGGFMSDLIFFGGKFAMRVGNQQFTFRNITINNAETAIYISWNWAWTFKTLTINNCSVGIDITSGGPTAQSVGSVIVIDADIINTTTGIKTSKSSKSQPLTGGSLILDNLYLENVLSAVGSDSGQVILAGPGNGESSIIDSWGQGQLYTNMSGNCVSIQDYLPKPAKSPSLLNVNTGKFFERPRPQYESYDVSDFVSVKDQGAVGDGKTDDTAAIQKTLQDYAGCKIIFFPAGGYVITSTVLVPAGSRLVGEVWSVIAASGPNFWDATSPQAVFKVGNSGDTGVAELSDLLFSVADSVPGAILVEWNIHDPEGQQGVAGMWDVHFRIGGALGTNLEATQCSKLSGVSVSCEGTFASLHLTSTSSAYLENVWAWNADHDLDGDHSELSIYNARGILIESANGPTWLYGTASEHNVIYHYSIVNARNIFLGMIQTETACFQSVPKAPLPFTTNPQFSDPDFSGCPSYSSTFPMAWGLHILSSENIYIYGAGHYTFFQNYNSTCLQTQDCQDSLVSVEGSISSLYIYNLNTIAAQSMVEINGSRVANQADNRNGFASTIAGMLALSNEPGHE